MKSKKYTAKKKRRSNKGLKGFLKNEGKPLRENARRLWAAAWGKEKSG